MNLVEFFEIQIALIYHAEFFFLLLIFSRTLLLDILRIFPVCQLYECYAEKLIETTKALYFAVAVVFYAV